MKIKNRTLFLLSLLPGLFVLLSGCEKERNYSYPPDPTPSGSGDIKGVVINAITLKPISKGTILLTDETGSNILAEKRSDPNGKFSFQDVPEGVYNLILQQNGYQEMKTAGISVGEYNPAGNFAGLCAVPSSITKPVASVSGIVLDAALHPLAGVTVELSAETDSLTNGFFTAVVTDSYGQYYIPAISLTSSLNTPLSSFRIMLAKMGYQPFRESEIELLSNQTTLLNFQLEPSGGNDKIIFEENFETPASWTFSGFWHRQATASVTNTAYPQYVKTAPDDDSEGVLPAIFSGQYCAWYGDENTGNYMGTAASGQGNLSGGTSVEFNSGLMTSPPIHLISTSGHAALSFWTWFETESRNPGRLCNDRMEILVFDSAGTVQMKQLALLNPYVDPLQENRDALPFTSGGMNKSPVWRYQTYDLSAFTGLTIRLGFRFDTRDVFSNGFRGWMIDDVKVCGNAMKK